MFFLANPEDQEQRVSRNFYLARLSEYAKLGKNAALVGPRKSGKSSLAKELVEKLAKSHDILPVYVGLNRTSTPPENFSIELMGAICFWSLGAFPLENAKNYIKFQSIEYLLSIKDQFGKNAADLISSIGNELQKIHPNQKLMLQNAFSFADEIAKKNNKKILLVLDDFDLLFDLNNFSQIKDVISLMDFKNKNVHYLAISSSKTTFISEVKSAGNFTIEEVKGFSLDETEKLIEKTSGKLDKKIVEEIYSYSEGLPVLTKAIAARYSSTKNVKKAFVIEMTLKNSASYHFMESMLNDYLYKARGEAMPRAVIKALCFMKDSRLTEISKKIYRSAPVTKSLLERVMQVDIIIKVDNKYKFSNSSLKNWLKLAYSGYEFENVPSDEILESAKEVIDDKEQ